MNVSIFQHPPLTPSVKGGAYYSPLLRGLVRQTHGGLVRLLYGGVQGCVSLILIFTILILFLITTPALAEQKEPVKPAAKDKCPVCGMFVAKYPDFIAEIIFRDGSYAVFDGIKDMLKYYYAIEKYNPKKKQADIDSIYVTDYYDLKMIDAINASYVIGSNVYGPMGREIIPFKSLPDAQEFMKDHRGKAVLRFREITPDALKGLD
jgi:nitrous oxide reductase accessory protein NosL